MSTMSGIQAQETLNASSPADWFLKACRDGHLSRTDAMSLTNDQDMSTRSLGLKSAVENGHFNVVRYLLEIEPAIDVGWEIARSAAHGDLVIYRLLHSKYPDMPKWSFGRMGDSVLTAVRNGNTEMLTYALENGGDPGRTPDCNRDAYIFTPIEVSALMDNDEAARILVKHGATFKATEALEIAASRGQLKMVRCFTELGAEINYVRGLRDPFWDDCTDGCTGPLHAAAKNGHREVVEVLLAHGADPHLQDVSGMTAIDAARGAGNEDILHLLVKAET